MNCEYSDLYFDSLFCELEIVNVDTIQNCGNYQLPLKHMLLLSIKCTCKMFNSEHSENLFRRERLVSKVTLIIHLVTYIGINSIMHLCAKLDITFIIFLLCLIMFRIFY